jgi:hypothetical protein
MGRRTARALALAVAGSAAALLPAHAATSATGISLVTLGTTQPWTFNAVVGSSVFFSTAEQLAANDLDTKVDVYRWRAGQLALMTPGSDQDVQFDAAVRGGDVVFGSTRQGHLSNVLYLWRFTTAGGGEFNSTGTGEDATFRAASPDGSVVVFESAEDGIDFDDDNGAVDAFTAVFADPLVNQAGQVPLTSGTLEDVHVEGVSADARSIVYSTDEKVDPVKDANTTTDLYGAGDAWSGPGYPPLLSDGTGGPDTLGAIAADGGSIVYTSADDSSAAGDTDGQPDVYWSMGLGADLISAGTSPASYAGATPGLDAVFYRTQAALEPSDLDLDLDIYTRTPESLPALVSTESGGSGAATARSVSSAAEVVYDVGGRLFRFDGSGSSDPLSPPSPVEVTYAGSSANGDVFFTSASRISETDDDLATDVYVNHAGAVSLVSGGTADEPATFEGASTDGSLVVFGTEEPLTAADTDALPDLYVLGPVGSPPTPPDTVPPSATVRAAVQENDGRLEITLSCRGGEACTATPRASLKVPVVGARARTFQLTGPTVTVAAGRKGTLKVKVPRPARRAAAAALEAGKKVKAKVVVTVRDKAGNQRTLKLTVWLKR